MYRPEGCFLWDPWFIKHGERYYMFHLYAPFDADPETRHHRARIGIASSSDLVSWEPHRPVWSRNDDTAWDSLAQWTGSVYRYSDTYYLFYTGRSSESFWRQRIGKAISTDLIHWDSDPHNPVLDPDPAYYDFSSELDSAGVPPAWRDPFVLYDNENQQHVMLVCAQKPEPDNCYRACIGVATSSDLTSWIQHPPLLAPDRYSEMEVPQLVISGGYYYVFFSTKARNYAPHWALEVGAFYGWHCYASKNLHGPYEPANKDGKVQSPYPIFNARLLEATGNGEFLALGWLDTDSDGNFLGRLSEPMAVRLKGLSVTIEAG